MDISAKPVTLSSHVAYSCVCALDGYGLMFVCH